MGRGRKGQPAEVKEAKGNPGKRPNPMASTDDLPELEAAAPKELRGEARKIYAEVAKQLAHVKLLRASDRQALARYCDTLNEYWKVTRKLQGPKARGGGYTYEAKTTSGGKMLRANPLFMIQDRLARRLDTMEDRFGLNPRARQEIMYRLAQQGASPQLPFPGGEDERTPGDSDPEGAVGFLNRTPGNGQTIN